MRFNRLFDYSYRRSLRQALIFYFTHIIFLVLIAFCVELLIRLGDRQVYERWSPDFVGILVALFFSLFIFFLILFKKTQWRNVRYLFLVIISVILVYFGGGFLGFIPIAYMSTVVNNNEVKKIL